MDRLGSAKWKLERSRSHSIAAGALLSSMPEDAQYRGFREFDPERGCEVFKVKVGNFAAREPILREVSGLVGESLCALRSSLDHLAFALAVKPKRPDDISFPICATKERFDAVINKCLAGVSEPAREEIRRVQPYHAGDPFKMAHLLWGLHRLANIDKHRFLHVSYAAISFAFRIGNGPWATGLTPLGEESLKKDIVLKLDSTSPFGKGKVSDFKIQPALAIVVDEPGLAPAWQLPLALSNMHKLVRYQILPRLEGFVSESD